MPKVDTLYGLLWDFVVHCLTLHWQSAAYDLELVKQWFITFGQWVGSKASEAYDNAKSWAEGKVNDLWDNLNSAWSTISDHWGRLAAEFWEGYYYISDFIYAKRTEAVQWAKDWAKVVWEDWDFTRYSFGQAVSDAWSFLCDWAGSVKEFFQDPIGKVWDWAVSKFPGLADLKADPAGYILGKMKEAWDKLTSLIEAPFTWIDDYLRAHFPLYALLRDDPKEFLITLVENFNPDAADFIRDPLGWLWNNAVPWLTDKIYVWLCEE